MLHWKTFEGNISLYKYYVSTEAKKIISRTRDIVLIYNSSMKVTNFTRKEWWIIQEKYIIFSQ